MENISRTAKVKLIITEQISPLEVNLNSVTAEDSNIENTSLFDDNLYDEMKYHWIDYPYAFPSDRLISPFLHIKMLILSSNKRFRQ